MPLSFATSGKIVYAVGGALAIVGFFLPWLTFETLGMPEHTTTVSVWSGWSNPQPLSLLVLATSMVAVILSATPESVYVLWMRLMTVFGLCMLIVVTALLVPDDQAVPASGLPPHIDFGLILIYGGYVGMIVGSFVLARRAPKATTFQAHHQ